jgi:ribosome maturation protein Sdo1
MTIFENIRQNERADSITLKNFFETNEILKQIEDSRYLSIFFVMRSGIIDLISDGKKIKKAIAKDNS